MNNETIIKKCIQCKTELELGMFYFNHKWHKRCELCVYDFENNGTSVHIEYDSLVGNVHSISSLVIRKNNDLYQIFRSETTYENHEEKNVPVNCTNLNKTICNVCVMLANKGLELPIFYKYIFTENEVKLSNLVMFYYVNGDRISKLIPTNIESTEKYVEYLIGCL